MNSVNIIHLVVGVADCQKKLSHSRSSWLKPAQYIHTSQVKSQKLTFEINAFVIMDEIKEEIKTELPDKAEAVAKHLWEGKIRLGENNEDIWAPIYILHKDDSKNGCRLFDWTSGKLMKIHFPLELQLQF